MGCRSTDECMTDDDCNRGSKAFNVCKQFTGNPWKLYDVKMDEEKKVGCYCEADSKCCDTLVLSSTGRAESLSSNYNKKVLGVYVRCKHCGVPFMYKHLGG